MQVGPITHANAHALAHARSVGKPEVSKSPVSTNPLTVEPPAQNPPDTEKAKGVLRLLEQGHFKGVADVRLRINFHEQIQAADLQARQQITHQAVGDLTETVNTQLDKLVDENELSEQQLTELTKEKEAFDQAVSAAGQNPAQLTEDVQSAFDAFAQVLETFFVSEVPSPEETAVTDEPDVITAVEEPPASDPPQDQILTEPDPLEALKTAFAEALQAIQDSLDSTESLLPPLSPPNGKGSAYDKFLAIYNELYRSAEPSESQTDSEPLIDLEA